MAKQLKGFDSQRHEETKMKNKEIILEFMESKPKEVFTIKEIVKETKITNPQNFLLMLMALRKVNRKWWKNSYVYFLESLKFASQRQGVKE